VSTAKEKEKAGWVLGDHQAKKKKAHQTDLHLRESPGDFTV
jgi:hypothetical protein